MIAPRRLEILLTAGLFAALALWAADDLRAWARLVFAPPTFVQTPAPEGCRLPGEGEHLLIYVVRRGERIAFRCDYSVTRARRRVELQGYVL